MINQTRNLNQAVQKAKKKKKTNQKANHEEELRNREREITSPDLREWKESCEGMHGQKGEGNGSNSQVGFSPP